MAQQPTAQADRDNKTAGAKTKRPNRKVSAILRAAHDLFLTQGFDTITMDMVTREAGVSKATLYVHFAGKEELFAAVMAEEARRVADAIWTDIRPDEEVEIVLRRVARNFVDIFLTEQALFFWRAAIGAVPRFPAIGRAIFESGPAKLTDRLADFLVAAHDRGALKVDDGQLAAKQFLSIVRGDIDLMGMLSLDLPSTDDVQAQIDVGILVFMDYYST